LRCCKISPRICVATRTPRLSVGRHTETIAGLVIHLSAMLSPGQRVQIGAEIARLEEYRKTCNSDGIRKVIEGWIEQQKKILAEGTKKDS
jgi:hypothetical protein